MDIKYVQEKIRIRQESFKGIKDDVVDLTAWWNY